MTIITDVNKLIKQHAKQKHALCELIVEENINIREFKDTRVVEFTTGMAYLEIVKMEGAYGSFSAYASPQFYPLSGLDFYLVMSGVYSLPHDRHFIPNLVFRTTLGKGIELIQNNHYSGSLSKTDVIKMIARQNERIANWVEDYNNNISSSMSGIIPNNI